MFLVVRDILFLAPRFNHGFLHVSPGATEKGREITPPEGSGSPNTHKRHLGSLSDSPRSDSDPKPNTSKGKAGEMAPEDRENVLSSPTVQGGPEQVTRKRRCSVTDSPPDDPKPKRSKGKAKAKEASHEDREGNSSIQGEVESDAEADNVFQGIALVHFVSVP